MTIKGFGFIALIFAVFSLTACTGTSGLGSSNSAGAQAGSATGSLLAGLYSSYKSTGKVDFANTATLSNVVKLGATYTVLRANKNNSSFIKDFSAGLVTGSSGLVTKSNSNRTVANLLSMDGLSGFTSGSSPTASNVSSGLTKILGSFGK